MTKAVSLREKSAKGQLVVGSQVFFTDASITEAMGCIGFEFVWIDAQFSAFDKEKVQSHIIAASSGGAASLVRVPENTVQAIRPILEMGPDGVIIPGITSHQDAVEAIEACAIPAGGLGGRKMRRANGYGNPQAAKTSSQDFLKVLLIEHVDGVDALDEILAVPGIDLIMAGPNDLASSIGLQGQTDHPQAQALYDELAEKCKRAGMPFGASLTSGDNDGIAQWVARGAVVISSGDDAGYLCRGGRDTLRYVRSMVK